ncbi:acyltransferase [Janibacter sp. CX7]|nr:acyltransferase [Janibacter sp. CX7]
MSHSYPIAGFSSDPSWAGLKLGTWSVGGFFAISGYLITRSAEGSGKSAYIRARLLRILPGLWFCALVTAFVISPFIGWLNSAEWRFSEAWSYAWHTMTFTDGGNRVGDVLRGNPLDAMNGSLWTLTYEVACYAGIAIVVWSKVLWRGAHLVVALVGAQFLSLAVAQASADGSIANVAYLLPFFLAGSTIYKFRSVVSGRLWLFLLALAALGLVVASGWGTSLASIPTAYVILWLGARLPGTWTRVGVTNDLSYGMYVFAFPVQQMMAAAGMSGLGPGAFVVVSILATVPVAYLSWCAVERPALRWVRARRAATSVVPVPRARSSKVRDGRK